MELLHHPHIIRIYEVIDTLTKINIIMEYASGGELYTKINKEGRLAESYAKKLFSQILSAIEHVHDKGIVHRDIKAENIFLFTGDTVKLGDFGFSTTCHENQLLTTYCGSPLYAAPELFKDEGYVGKYVDIWALGVLLYYMVTGKMPFVAETMSRLKKVINAGAYELPPSPIGYHLIDYEDEDEMLAQMESPNTTISDHQERTPKKSPSMSEKINEQSNSPNSKKKISTFFKQLKRTMTEENILDRKISPTSMTDYKNRVKIINPYAMNGKKLSDAEQAKHVANGIPGITQSGQYAAYFKNTGLTLTPECKYIIMGLLKTSPPNSRLSISKMRSSLWLKDQIFPKPLSPIRIIPPIQEEKGSLKRDPTTKGTPRRVRNESVNKEFEEVKQELLALGITETHLKEALTRNTRNSIIGTYRILLHKVHKSKKPIKLLRNINTSFLHPVGPKIQNTNTRENETDDVSSTKNAKTISNINENNVKESDKLLKESTKKLAILKENPIEANENNGGLETNKMPIKSSPPTSRKNDVITNDTRAARLTKKSSKICAII